MASRKPNVPRNRLKDSAAVTNLDYNEVRKRVSTSPWSVLRFALNGGTREAPEGRTVPAPLEPRGLAPDARPEVIHFAGGGEGGNAGNFAH